MYIERTWDLELKGDSEVDCHSGKRSLRRVIITVDKLTEHGGDSACSVLHDRLGAHLYRFLGKVLFHVSY